jgi:hypothetical protein
VTIGKFLDDYWQPGTHVCEVHPDADRYARTTDPFHDVAVARVRTRLREQGASRGYGGNQYLAMCEACIAMIAPTAPRRPL